ncbi:hypothetical protein [Absidia glauca]|uniref:Arb2 domain-containing protein n=1 Tax=Absidia glauca TaxID=4829 RepID=A0A163J9K7_ABSGL|nr:hypothetical protein [Absidia glauca]
MFRGKKKSKKETEPIPTTIDGFGYVIKEDGTVRSKSTDSQYVFDFEPKNQTYNETRYRVFVDLLGDVVEEKLQQAPFHFQKVVVPLQANDAHTYFYMTPNALTTKGKLVLFIPGTQTRIGQWSKRVMCEESIQAGSMMDMAEDMINRGYEVILMNPNGIMWYDNAPHDVPPLKSESWSIIPGKGHSDKCDAQQLYLWRRQAQAEKIGVVALGYGGHCFTEILNEHFDVIKPKVVGVAIANTGHLSDCIHGSDKRAWMYDHVVNWTVSDQTKGENVPNTLIGCASVSAGPVDDDSDDLLAEDDIYMEQEQLQALNLDDPDSSVYLVLDGLDFVKWEDGVK